jgi:hypothetical protein
MTLSCILMMSPENTTYFGNKISTIQTVYRDVWKLQLLLRRVLLERAVIGTGYGLDDGGSFDSGLGQEFLSLHYDKAKSPLLLSSAYRG